MPQCIYLFEPLHDRLPLAQDGEALYQAVDDGLILCKMVNLAAPDTIGTFHLSQCQTNA